MIKSLSPLQWVLLALLPSIFIATVIQGFGLITNILWCLLAALSAEAAVLRLRNKAIKPVLKDYSACLSAVILAFCLPAASHWGICFLAAGFAIIIAKQLYGGLGNNLFNPAMAGFAFVLVSFPEQLSLTAVNGYLSIGDAAALSLGLIATPDFYTAATALELVQNPQGLMMSQLWQEHDSLGLWATAGQEWINASFLLGGAFLLYKKVIHWRAPLAMLASIIVLSTVFYDSGSSQSWGSPAMHLLAAGTSLAAFFIITDPVSGVRQAKAQWLYGCLIGILVIVLRQYASFPDSIAFSVLIANAFAPWLDELCIKEAAND